MLHSYKKRHIVIIIVIIGVVCLIGLFSLPFGRIAVYTVLNDLKLIPIPEHFTELYFEDPSLLPRQAQANKPIEFSFTIHNLEGATTEYPYQVYFEYPTGEKVMFANSFTMLDDNASTTIHVTHTFRSSNVAGKVVVSLTSLKQEIDFLLPNTN